ncbi:MAG: hypothetical protein Kow00121_08530 [Elainellaceae cyanobacterium]
MQAWQVAPESLLSVTQTLPQSITQQSIAQQSIARQSIAQQSIAQQETLTQAEIYDLGIQVELLPRNQLPRTANLGDVLVPLDSVQTAAAASSFAELLFNEGSIARVDQNTTFFFRQGLRRFQLPNRVALNETIFVLENGVALIMSPPDSTGTQVETPEAIINIVSPDAVAAMPSHLANQQRQRSEVQLASHMAGVSDIPAPLELSQTRSPLLAQATDPPSEVPLLPSPDRNAAVMVVHDAAQRTTQVFALTDGDITVSDLSGENLTPLLGGQTVAVTNGQVGEVMEFDLEAFYRNVALAAGLGPGQEGLVAQEPAPVQVTLNIVREATLAALRRQEREQIGFSGTFLRDALNGLDAAFPQRDRGVNDRDFNGQRGTSNIVIRQAPGSPADGVFRDNASDDDRIRATFTPNNDPNNPVLIEGDINTRRIRINGQAGRADNVGISGDTAAGEVIFDNGRIIRIEVFDVDGSAPEANRNYPGRIIEGIAPDY